MTRRFLARIASVKGRTIGGLLLALCALLMVAAPLWRHDPMGEYLAIERAVASSLEFSKASTKAPTNQRLKLVEWSVKKLQDALDYRVTKDTAEIARFKDTIQRGRAFLLANPRPTKN